MERGPKLFVVGVLTLIAAFVALAMLRGGSGAERLYSLPFLALTVMLVAIGVRYWRGGDLQDVRDTLALLRPAPPAALVVPLPPGEAIQRIVDHAASEGFDVAIATPITTRFTRHAPMSKETLLFCVALILFGIGILLLIAYVLYYWIAKPTAWTAVIAKRVPEGSELSIRGNDRKARRDLRKWILAEWPQPTEEAGHEATTA